MSDRLFTYGTLRPSLYPAIQKKGVHALIRGFKMYNLGSFPCLVESDSLDLAPIVGEIIVLPTVTVYDAYEGFPYLYNRKLVDASVGNLVLNNIWVYYMKPESFDREHGAVSVPSGDWADVLAVLRGKKENA